MDTIAARIDALFAPWSGLGSPGAVWSVTRHGRTIHSGAVGLADIPHGVPLDQRSVVRIGSQTKQFTVLLALMLEADGLLSLDDEVHRHAPWLPAFPHPVTLRHLATNTSGLRDVLEVMTLSGVPLAAPVTRARQRDLLARHGAVNFVPGTQMIYCNTGFWLLSEIVEQVSGRSFDELLAERITGPLGMADTRLLPRDTQVPPRLAAQHARGPGGAWETARWGWEIGGEGGMASTLDDMARWQANLADPHAGTAALLAHMAEPVVYANGTTGLYAMGLIAESYRGLRHVGHGGSIAGGRSESMWFPEAGLGIAILANLDAIAPYSLALRIADIVLADEMQPVPEAGPALPAGLYRTAEGEVLDIRPSGEMVTGAGPVALRPAATGVFVPERPVLHMTLARGAEDGVLDTTWCGEARRFRRLPDAPLDGATLVARYVGPDTGLTAEIRPRPGGARILLSSEFGVHRLDARWVDEDLMLFAPDTMPAGADRWVGSARVSEGELVLTTDRTKNLSLRPA